jgi:hypothetical protein
MMRHIQTMLTRVPKQYHNVLHYLMCYCKIVMDYHVSSSQYPVELEVLVGPDEALGADRFTPLAVDGLPG